MTTTTLSKEQIEKKALELRQQADSIRVRNEQEYEAAGGFLKAIKGYVKQVDEFFDPHIKRAREVVDGLRGDKKKYTDPADQLESAVKSQMRGYYEAQEQKRRAEQERLEAEARKKAEDEGLAKAAEMEKAGRKKEAEQFIEEPLEIAPVVAPPAAPKISGVSFRERWTWELTSKTELVKAVAAGTVPLAALEPATSFLGQQARSLKAEMKYPGIRVFAVKDVAAGS